jgi:hypothetical protein
MEKETKNHKITDCTLYWCNLHEPNQYSDKYQVNATNLSNDDAKALKKLGLTIHDGKEKGKPEMGLYVVAKAMRPVAVVDSLKNTIEDTSNIGNGSKNGISKIRQEKWGTTQKKLQRLLNVAKLL